MSVADSNSDWDDSDFIYPKSLDDPARTFVYQQTSDDLARWFGTIFHGGGFDDPPDIAVFLDKIIRLEYPEWLTHFESPQKTKCLDICDLGYQSLKARQFFKGVLLIENSDENMLFKLLPVDDKGGIIDVRRSIEFSASVEARLVHIAEPMHPPSAWPIIFNNFFETIRADFISPYDAVDIEYSPKWCLRTGFDMASSAFDANSFSHLLPDTVFYTRIKEFANQSLSAKQREQFILRFHPSHFHRTLGIILIPLLIIEYVKISAEADTGPEPHFHLLRMALASACGFYKTLNINLRYPVFGMLVNRWKAKLYAAWEADSETSLRYIRLEELDLSEPLDALKLRLFMWKLIQHGNSFGAIFDQDIIDSIMNNAKRGALFHWKSEGTFDKLHLEPISSDGNGVANWVGKSRGAGLEL